MSSPSLLREFTNSEKAMERWYEVLSSGWHLRELESCKKKGIKILVFNEEGYPSSLNRLSNPPLLLYWWGNLKVLKICCGSGWNKALQQLWTKDSTYAWL